MGQWWNEQYIFGVWQSGIMTPTCHVKGCFDDQPEVPCFQIHGKDIDENALKNVENITPNVQNHEKSTMF